MRARVALALGLGLAGGCGRARPPAGGAAAKPCPEVSAAALPAGNPNGRWGVELGVQGAVLARHAARFKRHGIDTPNGQAWSDVLEQCLGKTDPGVLHGVELDPEAGALHAWVASDADKDRWVATLCRAVHDAAWLETCLSGVDLTKLDN